MLLTIIGGALCAGALLLSFHATRDQRGEAIFAALVFTGVWICYVLSWTPLSPGRAVNAVLAFYGTGSKVQHADMWLLVDAIAGGVIVVRAFTRRWAWVLWILYAAQVFWHLMIGAYPIDFGAYSYVLDLLFMAQAAVFVAIGGRNALDHVLRYRDLARMRLRGGRSASRLSERSKGPKG